MFTCCNLKTLNQLDCIADWKKLDSLAINKEDNPICSVDTWRLYAITKLASLQLKKINDQSISQEEILKAQGIYSPVVNLPLRIPDITLLSILGHDK
jgi:hypothetical protein